MPNDSHGQAGVHQSGFRASDTKPTKIPECVRDGIAEAHQRWQDRLSWNSLDIAKEYVGGRLELVIAINPVAGKRSDVGDPITAPLEHHVFTQQTVIGCEINKQDALDSGRLEDWRDDGVLLCVVELREPVEGLPSTFRVNGEVDEEVDSVLPGCFYSFARGFEINPLVPGWKLRVPAPRLVDAEQFPSGVIKGGSKVVDGIAQNEGQFGGQRGVEENLEKEGAVLFLLADAHSVTVVPSEVFKRQLEVADVMIGPF